MTGKKPILNGELVMNINIVFIFMPSKKRAPDCSLVNIAIGKKAKRYFFLHNFNLGLPGSPDLRIWGPPLDCLVFAESGLQFLQRYIQNVQSMPRA